MLDDQLQQAMSFDRSDFARRHIGPSVTDQAQMLESLGFASLEEFVAAVVPNDVLVKSFPSGPFQKGCSEIKALDEITEIADKNQIKRSLIGLGYYGTATPLAIKRHVFENPSWYTSYTPYQAEISQGRLEALFNFQTLITELTGLPIANASLLDEATAACEAMSLSFGRSHSPNKNHFLVDSQVFPQTLAVLRTRAEPLGIVLDIAEPNAFDFNEKVFGIFIQLPGANGRLFDPREIINKAHNNDSLVTISIDPIAQVLITPVGELGADIAIGSAQRLGVPLGFGGPHAAFFATKDAYKRLVPGRLVGESIDAEGNPALRLALQTREQHIRRDKATSNICTAQVLLAVIASFYAVYHGPDGLRSIAREILYLRQKFQDSLIRLGFKIESMLRFDSIDVYCSEAKLIHELALAEGFNLRILPIGSSVEDAVGFGVTFDELSNEEEVLSLLKVIAKSIGKPIDQIKDFALPKDDLIPQFLARNAPWLQQESFNSYHSETNLLRYIYALSKKDFSLVDGMIPLGSCTMKLNAASELDPVGWDKFSLLHPFAPKDQCTGYAELIDQLTSWLAYITGFASVSMQPNAGSQGEFAGLLVIQAWHKSRSESHRNVCLIPTSAHGTNPASAVMAGMKVVPIECDQDGNIDLDDLTIKAAKYSSTLSAMMITYPSTHGVFEAQVNEICSIVHSNGGQVYLDGANLNAQVGICLPANYGVDVCHLNLHKTFCIPHGGGGPGVGPIAVAKHLSAFLPGHPMKDCGGEKPIGAISAAPWGSASILPISWMYLRMMGLYGLKKASSVALMSANYIANRLKPFYPILFRGTSGLVAHECILDLRMLKQSSGISVEDIAKRLMDYGFHAPTISWPVPGTLMVEPTESESLEELDRFCEAMIAIRSEIAMIENGEIDRNNNPLKNAPHTISIVTSEIWDRPYSRNEAVFPLPNQHKNKFWPSVSRINNAHGDRNLICSCSFIQGFD